MSTRILTPLAACLSLIAGVLLPSTSHALMIAVYTQDGDSVTLEEMKGYALSVRDGQAVADERFTHKTSETAVVSGEFSVPPGATAYFWADQTFESVEGFLMEGEAANYEAEFPLEEELAKEALGVETTPQKVYVTALRTASLSSGELRVSYSLSKPGSVLVEAYGINGQKFGRWNLQERSAGVFDRAFTLLSAAKGPVYMRWTTGNIQAVQKLNPNLVKAK